MKFELLMSCSKNSSANGSKRNNINLNNVYGKHFNKDLHNLF